MTIEKYGSLWCIDHCYPLAKCVDETDIYQYIHWVNLRPIYCSESNSKGSKIDHYLCLLQEIKAKYFLKLNEEGLN